MNEGLFRLWLAVAMINVQRAWWWHLHGALWGLRVDAQRGGAYRSGDSDNPITMITADMANELAEQWWGPRHAHKPTPYATEHWPRFFLSDEPSAATARYRDR